jgi:asparagine synthase (glutamine-hydrolysing)
MNSHKTLQRVVDLLPPQVNRIYNMSVEEARFQLFSANPEDIRRIQGSFALIAVKDKVVRMARSMDRPMRYFLAKKEDGPLLIVADRIDEIYRWLKSEGLDGQFHPSYTRMVPAHYVVEIHLVGCPDPSPVYRRFFTPVKNRWSTDLDEIGRAYIGALMDEIAIWLRGVEEREPIGVCFSGGVDSGAVFLSTYYLMLKMGMNPSRLKAFTLTFGDGEDIEQAKKFMNRLGLGMFLEPIESNLEEVDPIEAVSVVEDYKPLDVECASMMLALCRGIRKRYPDWKYLIDGDGGDENLKNYPIEENPELTIRSVVSNMMLYHEGWGVGKFKHSLTYSGGLSRSYTRTYAPAKLTGFEAFSPFTRANVIEVSEGIPFEMLTGMSVERLYSLKGEIVCRGIKALTGFDMPVFPKRRFQHGAIDPRRLRMRLPASESVYRNYYMNLYFSVR